MTYSPKRGWKYALIAIAILFAISLVLGYTLGSWAQFIEAGAAPFIAAYAYRAGVGSPE